MGYWYAKVPKEPKRNVEFRLATYRRARDDAVFRAAMMKCCEEDLLFFIAAFGWQFNPKEIGREVGPFIPHPFQADAVAVTVEKLFERQDDVLWEKSRYQGATWLALFIFVGVSLFYTRKKFLWISHSEAAVDNGDDPDCLFWKIEFIHEHLPGWMQRGVKRSRKSGFNYVETKSVTTGAATTERSGVGGRGAAVGLDEFSKQRDDFKILGQTADTGPRLFIGTHYGVGTAFYELTQRVDQFKVILHWSQNPSLNAGLYRVDHAINRVEVLDKSYVFPADYQFVTNGSPTGGPFPGLRSPWYDRECRRRKNARDVAMHLDIDPKGSSTQFFDALMIHRLRQKTWSPLWEGDLHHDRDTGRPNRLVGVAGGKLKLWIHPTSEGRVEPGRYAIGADCSAGMGSTPSCVSIVNGATGVKVGEYMDAHIDPKEFGTLLVALSHLCHDGEGNGAKLVWEKIGPGEKVGKQIIELGYRNLYYRTNAFGSQTASSDEPGWNPTGATKRILLDDYRAGLDDGTFTNPSDRALEATLDFRYDRAGNPEHPGQAQTEDPSAGRVNHGDMPMADALACMLSRKMLENVGPAKKKPVTVPVGSLAWRRELHDAAQGSMVWE